MSDGYKSIPGWFDFQNIYQQAVNEAAHGAHFVEIGCSRGRSAAYMAAAIHDSAKCIHFDCIDPWPPRPGMPDGFYYVFLKNIDRLGLTEYVRPIRLPSLEAVLQYADGELDFGFIDGNHTYEMVGADIDAWLPKIKPGGVLAGHDYRGRFAGVRRAVNERFKGDQVRRRGNSWWHRVAS